MRRAVLPEAEAAIAHSAAFLAQFIVRIVFVVTALVSSLTSPSIAGAQAANQRGDVVPRQLTVNLEGALAPVNAGEIIANLGDEGLLNLRVHVNDEAGDIAALLRKKGLAPGPGLPPALERYLCRLNPHICAIDQREKVPAAAWQLETAPPDATVEGMSCAPSLPRNLRELTLPQFAVCLPDATVREYFTSRILPYDAKRQNLAELLTKRTGGCEVYDRTCRLEISSLNSVKGVPVDPFARSFAGELRLPVRGQSVTLPVFSIRHFGALTETLDLLLASPWRIGHKSFEQARLYYTVPTPARAQTHPGPYPWPDPVSDYMTVLNTMGYPFKAADRLNEIQPVTIGVWDTRVDDEHCDLVDGNGKAVILAEPTTALASSLGTAPSPTANCGEKRDFGRVVFDHGTHIAGILAGRVNGHGIAGVNPRADLWTYELEYGDRLGKDPDPITRVRRKRNMQLPVVNISLAFPATHGSQTTLAELIANFQDEILFVAAAGNSGTSVKAFYQCTVIPACWSYFNDAQSGLRGDNIISVVALSADGTALLRSRDDPAKFGTNHGRAFDVAAIGEVLSTVHGNYVSMTGGSSVATPYVTGLASLIYGTAPTAMHLSPRAVKERILATVDLSATFDDVVRFGRINFGRALDFGHDIVQLKKTACGAGVGECAAKVRVKKSDVQLIVLDGTLEAEEVTSFPLRVKDIRRIAAQSDAPDSTYWVVFVRDGRIKMLRDARFDPAAAFVYDEPKNVRVDVKSILDYTACSFSAACAR